MVNPTFCRMLGYSEEELSKKDVAEIIHPEDLIRDRLLMNRLRAGEIPSCQMEKRFFSKDGHIVWTLLNATFFRSPSGEPLHFIAQVQDITERKKMEAALQMSESMLRAIVDSARDAIFVKNIDLKYTLVNQFLVDLFEMPVSEIIGKSDGDLFGSSTADNIGEVDRQVLQGVTIEEEMKKPIRGVTRIFHTSRCLSRTKKAASWDCVGSPGMLRIGNGSRDSCSSLIKWKPSEPLPGASLMISTIFSWASRDIRLS